MVHDPSANCVSTVPIKYIPAGSLDLPWYDFDTVSSTMETAHELVNDGVSSWTAITARNQTSGRGTRGRNWSSRKGKGLWLSVIMPPRDRVESLDGFTITVAEILIKALRTFTDCPYTIKHPNDVLIRGRKLAGILVKTAIYSDEVVSVILGMGVNLLQTAGDFRQDGLPDATSMLIETGTTIDRDELLTTFLGILYHDCAH